LYGIILLAVIPFGLLSRQNLVGAALQYAPAQSFSMSLIPAALAFRSDVITSLLRTDMMLLLGDLSLAIAYT
jgi:hypothetical protein